MAKYKVEISGINTNDLKVLSQKEMQELFKKMHSGDPFARDQLVEGNLKLVLSILKKFTNKSDNMDDLFQIGCVGLLKAIDNFDLSHEVKFSTYAVPMILGEVRRYIRDNNSIRVSRSLKDLAYKALRLKEELMHNTNQNISIEKIAKELNVAPYEIVIALESLKEPVSMFEPIYSDGGDTIFLADQLEDKKNSRYPLETRIALNDSLQKLKEKERFILTERYLVGKTQMELAEEIGISQAQISRLEKNGIENLKKMIL